MTSLTLILILAAVSVASLLMVSLVNHRQNQARIIRQKLKQLRLHSDELEELVLTADQLLESRSVARLINDEVISHTEKMLQLDSRAQYLESSLANARSRAGDYSSEPQNRNVNRMVNSDAQIARAQTSLLEMGRIVRRIHSQSRLSSEELQIFIAELAWAHLMVNVISLIAHGYKAALRNDFLSADAFYKRAKYALVQTPQPDPRHSRMIKELGEMNNYRRVSLSQDLMHETVENFDADNVQKNMQTYYEKLLASKALG